MLRPEQFANMESEGLTPAAGGVGVGRTQSSCRRAKELKASLGGISAVNRVRGAGRTVTACDKTEAST